MFCPSLFFLFLKRSFSFVLFVLVRVTSKPLSFPRGWTVWWDDELCQPEYLQSGNWDLSSFLQSTNMLKENQVLVIVEWRDRLNWSIGPSFHGIIGKEKDTRKSIQENPGGLWFFKKKGKLKTQILWLLPARNNLVEWNVNKCGYD